MDSFSNPHSKPTVRCFSTALPLGGLSRMLSILSLSFGIMGVWGALYALVSKVGKREWSASPLRQSGEGAGGMQSLWTPGEGS